MDVNTLSDKLQYVALYLAVALVAAFIVVGLLVWFFKREKFNDYKKYAIGIATGFAITMVVVFAYVKFQCNIDDMQAKLFYPILATLITAVAGAIAMLVSSLFNDKAVKISLIVTAALLLGCFIATMVLMAQYYGDIAEYYPNANLVGMIVSAVVFMVIMVVMWFVGDKRKMSDTRSIVYGAISIALSFALSYAKLFKLPQGGSVTFASLLPLMVYCCMFGTRRGLVVCTIYGVLQALQDPFIIHPMQFLLDYPLAFGLIGVSGIFMEKGVFKEKKIVAFLLGGIIAVVLRYACHVCSGVFAFADYADLDKYGSAIVYSMAYNSFTFVDMALALVAGSTLFASKSFTALMQKSSDVNKLAVTTQTADGATGVDNDEELDEVDKQIIANQAKSENKDSNDNQDNR
ncbi:proton-coupled thiamine transporter YuaJ [Firmicutes bacterium CAG:475]|nr:proton-coupled thiamine transporter YuaJ [Firmicutes bacterium CAG:475]